MMYLEYSVYPDDNKNINYLITDAGADNFYENLLLIKTLDL